MADPLAHVRALFDPRPGSIYLDSATYGLPPRPTVEALRNALASWQAGTADWVMDWDRHGEVARAHFAALIGTTADCVALMPSASVGVATVAAALQAGDEVVVAEDEFTSVLFPLLVAQQRGARVRIVRFDDLAESVSADTRLVAFSLVQSHSGRLAALGRIVEAAENVGARTLVDATHGVPFVPLDAHIDRIDYLVCAAYKHLLCPRGVAFLYVRQKEWDRVPPIAANWRSTPDPYGDYYGGQLKLAATAARFDVSLAWHAWVGASISLGLLLDWQREGLLAHVLDLADRLTDQLGLPSPGSSVVSVNVDDAEAVAAHLAEKGIRGAVRAGSVRLAAHVYNTPEQIDAAVAAIVPFVRAPAASAP